MNYHSNSNNATFQGFPVNTGNNNQYFNFNIILQKICERMTYMVQRFCRVLFIRFDLRFPQHYCLDGGNTEVTRLFKLLKDRSDYHGWNLQFIWVREQSREKHQHYHCVVLLDGNKIRNYYPFLQTIEQLWANVLGVTQQGLVHYCNRDRTGLPIDNGIMIRRPRQASIGVDRVTEEQAFQQDFEHCYNWASYLAKVNQKANTPKGVRRFGVSQIRNIMD